MRLNDYRRGTKEKSVYQLSVLQILLDAAYMRLYHCS